jgi:hypothetical protein
MNTAWNGWRRDRTDIIRIEAEDAGRKPGDESLPSRWLGWRSQIGFLIC